MESQFINPIYTTPEYSTKLCRSYYNYLARQYNKDIFFEICKELNIPPDYLLADGNWVSDKFYRDFISLLKNKTGNQNIAGDVGESFLHPDNINPFETALLKLMAPELFFLISTFSAKKVNRRILYFIKKFRPGKVTLSLHSLVNEPHLQDICINMVGTLKGVRWFYDLDSCTVTHDTCIHRGDRECTFSIQYSSLSYWRRIFIKISGLALLAFAFVYATNRFAGLFGGNDFLLKFFTASTFLLVASSIVIFRRFYQVIKHHLIHYEQSEAKERILHENRLKLDRRYKEANLMRELSLRLIREKSPKDVIDLCVKELSSRFNFRRALVMLVSSDQTRLQTISVQGFEAYTDILYKLSVRYPAEKESPQLFANILEAGVVRLINDIDEFKQQLTPENQLLLTAFDVKSLIVAPIQDEARKYGILVIGAVKGETQLTKEDEHLIHNITNMLSLFFQNAQNFENERTLKSLFQKYVPSVVMDGISKLQSGHENFNAPQNNAITSMFIDLRSFTKMSEKLPPERVVEMLNIYIDHTTDLIAMHGGIIDNLIGDGIVAFFPAYEEHRTLHAKQAMICAIDILGKLDDLNKKLKQKGFPNAKLGIGLHSGDATIGNVGGRVRVNYTAIGDTVNVAARLEGLCKEFANRTESSELGVIVLSDSVLRRAPLVSPPTSVGELRVRGRDDLLNIYLIDKEMAETLSKTDSNKLFKSTSRKPKDVRDLDGERRNTKHKSHKKKAA